MCRCAEREERGGVVGPRFGRFQNKIPKKKKAITKIKGYFIQRCNKVNAGVTLFSHQRDCVRGISHASQRDCVRGISHGIVHGESPLNPAAPVLLYFHIKV